MSARMASRRALARQTAEAWRSIEAEGQGVFRHAFYSPLSFASVAADALAGDAVATAQAKAVSHMVAVINAARNPRDGAACLLCGAAVWRHRWPARIGVTHAACDAPTHAIANVVCCDCERRYPDPQSFNAAVLAFYREHVMDDVRALPPASSPGHA